MAISLPDVGVSYHVVGGGHELALQTVGDPDGLQILMLHGGPGYYWLPDNLALLQARLREAGHAVCLRALSARGCGTGQAVSRLGPEASLLDDDLLKRAADLAHFTFDGRAPDILLGHSTGAMVALTGVMENYCQPRALLLASPYTASLGEQMYWTTTKAGKYPRAFAAFHDFVAEQWSLQMGPVPRDLKRRLYEYWGELFFHLPFAENGGRDLQVKAQLLYGNFHVIDALPQIGTENGEPYIVHHTLLQRWPDLSDNLQETLWRTATITANWWRTNYQNGYPFLDTLKSHDFGDLPIRILSGLDDEITPPATVRKLAGLLDIDAQLVPGCGHLAESNVQGRLDIALAECLGTLCADFQENRIA